MDEKSSVGTSDEKKTTIYLFENLLSFCLPVFLIFADTVEEFEDCIMQKKMKIPKMSIKNSGNSLENSFGEQRMPLRHKKV